ncbi:MAG: conjugal transfer protein TraX [Lachnospiraceae bacterium]|nr:conjugal transfer protein TraX [Lachnospiraceae bacterium]
MERSKGFTGSTLKLVAMSTMLIDHVAAVLLTRMYLAGWVGAEFYNVIFVLRLIGRVAFPIYCFLLVEGFLRTGNFKKYLLRMVLFAFVSEIPFDLSLSSEVIYLEHQNVMFTMTIGLLAMYGMKMVAEKKLLGGKYLVVQLLIAVVAAGVATLLKTDYSWGGVLCICAMYLFKASNARRALLGNAFLIIISTLEVAGLFSVPLIGGYNGERGLKMKYFFYAFYPVHLLLLYILCVLLGIGFISAV